jgi:hypothetical protein
MLIVEATQQADGKNSLYKNRILANDILMMLRTNEWKPRLKTASEPEPFPLSRPTGGNVEYYFIQENPKRGNMIIKSNDLARALINFNADLEQTIKEREDLEKKESKILSPRDPVYKLNNFKVCERCKKMHFQPDTAPHDNCSLGYLLWMCSEFQLFRSAGHEMRLNDAKAGLQCVYMPVHGMLGERIVRGCT